MILLYLRNQTLAVYISLFCVFGLEIFVFFYGNLAYVSRGWYLALGSIIFSLIYLISTFIASYDISVPQAVFDVFYISANITKLGSLIVNELSIRSMKSKVLIEKRSIYPSSLRE